MLDRHYPLDIEPMTTPEPQPRAHLHLFVLRGVEDRDPGSRITRDRALAYGAWAELRQRGLRVTVQHEHYALEVLATSEEAADAMKSRHFRWCGRGHVDPEDLARGRGQGDDAERARRVAALWNVRFEPKYRNQYHDRETPQPPLAIATRHARRLAATLPRAVDEAVAEIRKPEVSSSSHALLDKVLARVMPSRLARRSVTTIKDLDALGPLLEPPIDPDGGDRCMIRCSPEPAAPAGAHGRMVVAVILVQATAPGESLADEAQRNRVMREVIDGLGWIVTQHPSGDLTFVLRFELPESVPVPSPADVLEMTKLMTMLGKLWIKLDGVEYPVNIDEIIPKPYMDALSARLSATKAKCFFLTPIANHEIAVGYTDVHTWIAYCDNWRGKGEATVDGIVAHEMLHHFGAKDEYIKEGKEGVFRCDCMGDTNAIPNGNCKTCGTEHQRPCVMNGFRRHICPHTRAMIGWADLFVEIETAGNGMAGTDDELWLDLGDRSLPLGTMEFDDFEPGHTVGYDFWDVELEEVKRILLRKQPGDLASAWLPARVRVWHRTRRLCTLRNDDQRWVDDMTSTWSHPDGTFDDDYITRLEVELSTCGHCGSRSMQLWLDDHRWVLPCSIPVNHGDHDRAIDRFTLDPGTGLRRSSLQSIRLEWLDMPAGAASLAGCDRLVVRSNGSTLLEVVPHLHPPAWKPRPWGHP